jgi:hypothetical protein
MNITVQLRSNTATVAWHVKAFPRTCTAEQRQPHRGDERTNRAMAGFVEQWETSSSENCKNFRVPRGGRTVRRTLWLRRVSAQIKSFGTSVIASNRHDPHIPHESSSTPQWEPRIGYDLLFFWRRCRWVRLYFVEWTKQLILNCKMKGRSRNCLKRLGKTTK